MLSAIINHFASGVLADLTAHSIQTGAGDDSCKGRTQTNVLFNRRLMFEKFADLNSALSEMVGSD